MFRTETQRLLPVCFSLAVLMAACSDGASMTNVSEVPAATETDATDLLIEQPQGSETEAEPLELEEPETLPEAVARDIDFWNLPLPLLASGSEPFWTAEVDRQWIVFERPGLPLIEVPIEAFENSDEQVTLTSGDLTVSLTRSACVSASGSENPLSMTIAYDEIDYQGCAGPSDSEGAHVGEDADWKPLIVSSLTAIDACLEAAVEPRLVRALYPREPGTVGMVLEDEIGQLEECGADLQTGELYFLDPISQQQAQAWISGPASFARAGHSPVCESGSVLENGIGSYHPSGCK